MNQVYEKLMTCFESVRQKIDFVPKVALVLGSGLGDYGDSIQIEQVLDYHEIEGFPVSTVAGHKGRFLFGYVENVPVVIMAGGKGTRLYPFTKILPKPLIPTLIAILFSPPISLINNDNLIFYISIPSSF